MNALDSPGPSVIIVSVMEKSSDACESSLYDRRSFARGIRVEVDALCDVIWFESKKMSNCRFKWTIESDYNAELAQRGARGRDIYAGPVDIETY